MADLLTFPDSTNDDDLAIEPDTVDIEPDVESDGLAIAPDTPEPSAAAASLLSTGLIEILPADFPLPILARFIPNPALRVAADQAAAYAASIAVAGPEGLQRADLALTALRTSLKAIDEHFEEPTKIANDLHKRLTGIRGEWQSRGKQTIENVGRAMYTEQRRLDAIAAEERRQAQAEADRLARETARREAQAAAAAQAPAPVVEELQRQAETATAPPVAPSPSAPPVMKGSTTVTTWKARIAGTPGADDPNPETAELSPAQRVQVLVLLKAILDGRAPITAIEMNWKVLNARAKADKSTLAIPGIEAYEEGSVRAKGSRSRA